MLRDGLAEGSAPLGVANGLLKRGPGHAQSPRGHVQPLGFEPGHDLLEALPLGASDEILGRYREIGEMQLARFYALITQLVDIAADVQARSAFFDDKRAHSRVGR